MRAHTSAAFPVAAASACLVLLLALAFLAGSLPAFDAAAGLVA